MSAEFVEACTRRDLDAIKRMLEERGLTREQVAAINDHACTVRFFQDDLDVAQWLVDRDSVAEEDESKSFLDNLALRWACENGSLQAVEWFVDRLSLTNDDVRSDDNSALRNSCRCGRLEVAQWLVDRFGLTAGDARSDSNYALRFSCQNYHVEVAQWLVDRFHLTAADAESLDNYTLKWACAWQLHVVVRWLLTTFPTITILDECAAFVQEVREQMAAAAEEEDLMVKPAANTGE